MEVTEVTEATDVSDLPNGQRRLLNNLKEEEFSFITSTDLFI
jgi:hypothetical protein